MIKKTEIESYHPDTTFELAYQMGKNAKASDVLCLIGDLGVGKTLFTQGFAKGMGIEESVNSPTFTIVQEYQGTSLTLYHFDVYRIEEEEELEEIGYEEMVYGTGVSLIEWADLIEDVWPACYQKVVIEKNLEKGFDYRKITIYTVS